MAEFQVALVFPIRLPPGVLRSIRPLQGFPIKLVLQLTLLELGTISPTFLQHTLGLFPMTRRGFSKRREIVGATAMTLSSLKTMLIYRGGKNP